MTIGGIISAIIVGAILGVIGRAIAPGRQNMGWVLTIVVGIVAAFIGGFIAHALGFRGGIVPILLQVVLATVGVAIVGGTAGRRNRALTHH
ncbi:GlsB/YeaQ/YmgE family stress response membrane protein [Kineococcus sp. NUM-3379]